MVIELTPLAFQDKLQAIRCKSQKLISNGNTGMISNSDVTLGYSYDGIGELTITVLQKHSLRAKLATQGIITKSIAAIFATL